MTGLIVTSIIGVIAIVISALNALYAKNQLDLAKTTKSETQKLLDAIDRKTNEIKKLSEDTQKSINDQISTILKNFDPKVQSESKLLESLAPAILQMALQDPSKFAELNKMFNSEKNN